MIRTQKQLVVDSLKDNVSKVVISTVDHLGSIASKLDTFLDEKVDEFSATKLRFSCIEQVNFFIAMNCLESL
nr:protein ABIL2-like [Ipomoea trifida]GMD22922.1 protein ABIL2-like isoform X1 [Ipomoea batatas]